MIETAGHSRFGRLWLHLLAGATLLFLIAPIFLIVPLSFSDSQYLKFPPDAWSLRWYERLFTSREWRQAAIISLQAAFLTVAVALPLGTLAAYGLHKSSNAFSASLRALLISPIVVPIVILAIGIFFLLAFANLNNTLTGLVLAHSVLAIPYVMIAVGAALSSFDFSLERAARSLGASPVRTFFTVTVPQIRGSLVVGGLLAFLTSLDEVVVSLFISSGPRSTLPRRMYASMRDQVEPTVAAVSTLLIGVVLLVIVTMFVTEAMQRGRSGSGPR